MDRNRFAGDVVTAAHRRTHHGCVDRNSSVSSRIKTSLVAPITGAWIETGNLSKPGDCLTVAPITGAWIETISAAVGFIALSGRTHHGCVDRNTMGANAEIAGNVAPITGAWIETSLTGSGSISLCVAPITGAWIETRISVSACRKNPVAPITGAWIETAQN